MATATTGARQFADAGFTLVVSHDGTVTLTWKQMFDPAAVQDALARAGVPRPC